MEQAQAYQPDTRPADPPKHQQVVQQLTHLKRQLILSPTESTQPLRRTQQLISIVFPAFFIESYTFGLFAANCLIWSAQNLAYKFWMEDWQCLLIHFQCKYQPNITYGLQLWRLVVSSLIFSNWRMFVLNNFALNMLGYSLERESLKRFLGVFYLCIAVGNVASCVFQPAELLWEGCSSGTIGLLPLELERYMRNRHLPELRKRLIFLCVNFTLNLAINIETIVGNKQIDWVSHLAGLLMGILLVLCTSDYTVMPAFLHRNKYVLRKLCGIFAVAGSLSLLIISLTRLRINGVGRDLYNSQTCLN